MAGNLVGRLLRRVRAGELKSVVRRPPLLSSMRNMELSSSSFPDGGRIPAESAGEGVGDNVSPDLTWRGAPPGVAQYLLLIEDVDVPRSTPLLHTIALIDPVVTSERGGEETEDGVGHLAVGELSERAGVRFVPAGFGRTGYHGPRPIPGHGVHRYRFHLYALSRAIPEEVPLDGIGDVLAAIDGAVVAEAHLVGTMERE